VASRGYIGDMLITEGEIMQTRTLISAATLLASLSMMPVSQSFAQESRHSTVTTSRGGTITTTVDKDASDGNVGVQRSVTGPNGKTATASRGTQVQDGTVTHESSRTGIDGKTSSKQGVYTKDGSTHTHTTRSGKTTTWSRQR
jgi:hypothetical protein